MVSTQTLKSSGFDGVSFILFQSIATNGAYDWQYFNINGQSYLALANSDNGTNIAINSQIYKFSSSSSSSTASGLGGSTSPASFVLYQSIPTNGAVNWNYFTINNQNYLVVANNGNGRSNTTSSIFALSGCLGL